MGNVSTGTIIRTVCLILALVNNCLVMAGHSPLPIEDEQLSNLLSQFFTIATALWAWWKNNSYTPEAIEADAVMHGLKDGSVTLDWIEVEDEEAEENETYAEAVAEEEVDEAVESDVVDGF